MQGVPPDHTWQRYGNDYLYLHWHWGSTRNTQGYTHTCIIHIHTHRMRTLKCTDLWHNTVRVKSRYSFWKTLQTPIKYSPHIHEHHSPPAQYGMCDQLENPRAGCTWSADGPPELHWNSAFPVPHSKILQDVFSLLRLSPRIKPAWRFWQSPARVMEIRNTYSHFSCSRDIITF